MIKDEKTGLLFEEENSAQLAEKIERLLNDGDMYQQLAIEGLRDVRENYSIESVSKRMISVYRTIIRAGI